MLEQSPHGATDPSAMFGIVSSILQPLTPSWHAVGHPQPDDELLMLDRLVEELLLDALLLELDELEDSSSQQSVLHLIIKDMV